MWSLLSNKVPPLTKLLRRYTVVQWYHRCHSPSLPLLALLGRKIRICTERLGVENVIPPRRNTLTHQFLKRAHYVVRAAIFGLNITLLVVNEAVDAEAVIQAFHSSAHPHTPPFTIKMTHFVVTGGAEVQGESVNLNTLSGGVLINCLFQLCCSASPRNSLPYLVLESTKKKIVSSAIARKTNPQNVPLSVCLLSRLMRHTVSHKALSLKKSTLMM